MLCFDTVGLCGRKGIRPVKKGGWWRWALLSPDGVAPRVSRASVDRVTSEYVYRELAHNAERYDL